jgi:hypothetical protein
MPRELVVRPRARVGVGVMAFGSVAGSARQPGQQPALELGIDVAGKLQHRDPCQLIAAESKAHLACVRVHGHFDLNGEVREMQGLGFSQMVFMVRDRGIHACIEAHLAAALALQAQWIVARIDAGGVGLGKGAGERLGGVSHINIRQPDLKMATMSFDCDEKADGLPCAARREAGIAARPARAPAEPGYRGL